MKRRVKRYDEGGDVVDLRDDTSQPTGLDDDVRARARRFLETGKKDEESEPVRVKPKPKMSKSEEIPRVNGKTFSETISRPPKEDKKLNAAEIAKVQREGIAGPDKNLPAPEPKSAGKKFREFFGSKYKAGGMVASRGDGCAQRGKTKGRLR
jgi:hypothetical protein